MSALAEKLIKTYTAQFKTLAIAESCTGGLVCALITEIPGASRVLERGFITYSNQAKMDMLSVPRETLNEHGAVSTQTATAMAIGALKRSRADIAAAITGIAGPDGGTPHKPVGLVCFAIAFYDEANVIQAYNFEEKFGGTRTAIQKKASEFILQKLLEEIKTKDLNI